MSIYLPERLTGEPTTQFVVWTASPFSRELGYSGPSLARAIEDAQRLRRRGYHVVDVQKHVESRETVERFAESEDFMRGFWEPTFKKLGWVA